MNNIVLFDIDGTLANCQHRKHFVETSPKNWDAFFEACDRDEPIEYTNKILDAIVNQGNSMILYATGRPERVREKTKAWLHYNCYDIDDYQLYMRKDGDHRPDHIVKYEILWKIIEDWGRKPSMVFDDRNSVVKMWRENNVPCLQVADGDF
jgi:FMN phosphatase YigB (HAD superfamily)